MKGDQDLNGLFPAVSKVPESIVVLSSHPPLEPTILVLERPIFPLLWLVETAKNESDEGDVVVDQALTRRGSESHP